ncbi:hypothetical protein PCO86_11070 [Pectobacteriaceae bacterium CE70]|nr:hypothetical protein [Prodigiosinella sp. LS101]WJV56280.1 hypothetical protein PCO84_11620 [Pectobacteriaceae bacterium C111]WJV60692.1 hypothetical protein PCO87_11990 [Pectobacteriaceae bacterium C52]WJV68868.1 hypothetical protein PCO86_11070 [Pectobacteriaceae bacterium CE70]WJY12791.1 hypothetical protein PCO80_10915 [Pectobacteriaceae bacterium C80]WJV51923.1 hypothetical protein PCO85_11615 [Prodigiosinella sp. LS101]
MNRRHFIAGSLATVAVLPFNIRTEALVKKRVLNQPTSAVNDAEPVVQLSDAGIIQQAVLLNINLVTGTLLNFSYKTLTGNQPNRFQNQVFLWPVSSDEIPWSSPAIDQRAILLDLPDGDQNMENVQISTNAYILGYSVGPERTEDGWSSYVDVVASTYIPALQVGSVTREVSQSSCCSIKPTFVGISSIAYYFSFLPGFYAKSSGSWVGVWEGGSVSYVMPPKWFAAIAIDSNTGTAGINGLSIAAGQKYTLGLYASGYSPQVETLDLKRLACTATFST